MGLRGLSDFLVEGDQFGTVGATAAGRIQFLLQLHAANFLIRLCKAVACESHAAERQCRQASHDLAPNGRLARRGRRKKAPKTVMDS